MNGDIKPFTGKALKNWKFNKKGMTLLMCLKKVLNVDIAFEICIKFMELEKKEVCNRQFEMIGRGTSKSAWKRRMMKFELCRNCGKFLHEDMCKQSTKSQYEVKELLRGDPIKIKSERIARKNSNALMMIERLVEDIERKKEKREIKAKWTL